MAYRQFKPLAAFLMLRKSQFALLLFTDRIVNGSGFGTDNKKSENPTVKKNMSTHFTAPVNNGLLLYHNEFSYYSQKVVLALHEKQLPFDIKLINFQKRDNYESWFLDLNPRGEVPVLQDTGKVIPDSARIIDYLEDNFSNGLPRLIPMDRGPEVRQCVSNFRYLLQGVPAEKLTVGAMLNPQFIRNPKVPFIAPVRRALLNQERNFQSLLLKYADKNPRAAEILERKAEAKKQQYLELSKESNYKKILDDVGDILTQCEEALSKNQDKPNWWLCCDIYTIADIELTILLVRINQLGLEHYFWTNGKRPCIEKYFERVKQRDSYQKTIPGSFALIKTIIVSNVPVFIGALAAAVVLIVGGAVIAKKYIF